jgi:hypothetical protein
MSVSEELLLAAILGAVLLDGAVLAFSRQE